METKISDSAINKALLEAIKSPRSVAPRDVALLLMKPSDPWQKLLPRIREVATKMHADGTLAFIRKGKVTSPEGLKGVYRFAKVENKEDS